MENSWERRGIAAILLSLALALGVEAWKVGLTVDEPGHLLSAHLYWKGQDRLKPRDMPPLIKMAGGWPSLFFTLPIPYDHRELWEDQEESPLAAEMLLRMQGPQIRRLVFACRLPLLIFPLLTCWLIWRWGREIFDPATGLLLAAAFALEPTALGHGALFKNDLAATFTYLLFWYCAWRFWKDPEWRTVAALGAALGLASLAKLSLLILLGVAPVLLFWRYGKAVRKSTAALALLLGIAYVGILAACQLEARRLGAGELAVVAADPRLPAVLQYVAPVFRWLPAPELIWDGSLAILRSNADGGAVYMLGSLRENGHPLYFLFAIAVKAPVALQVLVVWGAGLLLYRILRGSATAASVFFWTFPGLLYIALASSSRLQLGVRLALVALPFGLFAAGAAVSGLRGGAGRLILAGLMGWLAFASASTYPNGIAFFNRWTGGPENGLQYLADSNLDWGQSLGEVARYCRAHGIPKISVSYFGLDNPFRYFREEEIELVAPPWDEKWARGEQWQPKPGYYAISANLLPGFLFPERFRNYYQFFRQRKPVALAGYSILIYRVR